MPFRFQVTSKAGVPLEGQRFEYKVERGVSASAAAGSGVTTNVVVGAPLNAPPQAGTRVVAPAEVEHFNLRTEGASGYVFRTRPNTNANEVKEQLGKQMIEGVEAEGTRTTVTIPAGEIGNERPIEIVSERWYSPELQLVVMTKHSDPRSGETTYKHQPCGAGENAVRSPAGFQREGDAYGRSDSRTPSAQETCEP
jgi:hypothetical protein